MPDRKFAEWVWDGPHQHKFEVRYEWGTNNNNDWTFKSVTHGLVPTFYIKSQDPKMVLKSGDLQELARMLDEHMTAYYSMEWEPVLAVRWDHMHNPDVLGATTMEMRVQAWERGRTKQSDLVYWRNPLYKKAVPRVDPPRMRLELTDETIDVPIIEDTPENRAILKDVATRLGLLGDMLHELLRGDNVAAKLQQLTTLALPKGTE